MRRRREGRSNQNVWHINAGPVSMRRSAGGRSNVREYKNGKVT